jgi:hypothetical protein
MDLTKCFPGFDLATVRFAALPRVGLRALPPCYALLTFFSLGSLASSVEPYRHPLIGTQKNANLAESRMK